MMIIGVDYHLSFQAIAFFVEEVCSGYVKLEDPFVTFVVYQKLATPLKFRSRISLHQSKGIFGERRTAFVGPDEWLRGVGTEGDKTWLLA
jgi:hypothetical protein